jgi:ubiquinone biosynthesis protein UbiJ
MTELKLLKRDVETLKDSIRLEYAEFATRALPPTDLAAFHERIRLLQTDLDHLRRRMDDMST